MPADESTSSEEEESYEESSDDEVDDEEEQVNAVDLDEEARLAQGSWVKAFSMVCNLRDFLRWRSFGFFMWMFVSLFSQLRLCGGVC